MNIRWFTVSSLDVEDLAGLGVTVRPESGAETVEVDPRSGWPLVTVGNVFLNHDGTVTVAPRVGASRRPKAMPALLTKAEHAIVGDLGRFRKCNPSGPRPFWSTTVSLVVPWEHPLAAIAGATRFSDTAEDIEEAARAAQEVWG